MKICIWSIFILFPFVSFSQVPECNNPLKFSHSVNKDFVTELNGKPISNYLNHKDIDVYAKLYYQDKFAASVDTLTFAFLDSVLTKNTETKPFYLFVFNSVVSIADGALAEAVAETCWAFKSKVEEAMKQHKRFKNTQECMERINNCHQEKIIENHSISTF